MNFADQYVALRFRLWTNGIVWVMYEAFPEEGEGVSKKLRQFSEEDNARTFFEKHKELYTRYLQSFLEVKKTKLEGKPPTVLDTVNALKKEPSHDS